MALSEKGKFVFSFQFLHYLLYFILPDTMSNVYQILWHIKQYLKNKEVDFVYQVA